MDTKYIKIFSGFAIGTVVGGILTNAIVASVFGGDNKMSQILFCQPKNTVCAVTHLGLYTFIFALLIILVGIIINIIWWGMNIREIKIEAIPMPSRYPPSIGIDIANDKKYDLLGFSVKALYIKQMDFPSNLNTIGATEYYPFVTRKDSVLGLGKALVGIAESYGNEDDGFKTKFLTEDGGYIVYHYYFPVYQTDKNSTDSEKIFGDMFGQIYEIFIEVRGRIGEGKVSKIFRGKFSHIIYSHKWKKRRNRWVQYPPKYISEIKWIDFEKCTIKELNAAKRKSEKDRMNPSSINGDILTSQNFFGQR